MHKQNQFSFTFRSAGPLVHLLLPGLLQQLGAEDVPASLVQLAPVVVGAGVRPPLVLGVHPDLGRIFAGKGPATRNEGIFNNPFVIRKLMLTLGPGQV